MHFLGMTAAAEDVPGGRSEKEKHRPDGRAGPKQFLKRQSEAEALGFHVQRVQLGDGFSLLPNVHWGDFHVFPTAEVLEPDAVNMWIFPKMKAPKMGAIPAADPCLPGY